MGATSRIFGGGSGTSLVMVGITAATIVNEFSILNPWKRMRPSEESRNRKDSEDLYNSLSVHPY